MSAPIMEQQAEVLDGRGGTTIAWVPVAQIRQRSDLGRVYRGITLRRCAGCGRRCAPDCLVCLCGEPRG